MKTKNFKFKSMALVLFALVLSSNVWGADEVAYTNNCPANSSNNSYSQYYDVTINDIGWKAPGNQYQDGAWRVGLKAKTTQNVYLYTTTAISANITKVVVTHGASNSITVNSFRLDVYSTKAKAQTGGDGDVSKNITSTFTANGSTTFTRPTGADWTGRFYRFTYNFTSNSTSARYVTPASYVFYKSATPSCTTPPTVSASLSSTSSTTSSITATVGITSIGGCDITENGLVYSTTEATPTVGGSGCSKETVTACGSTAANKTVTISGLACGQRYYVCGYATNAAGTRYSNVSQISTSACPVDHFIDNIQETTGYTGDGKAVSTSFEKSSITLSDKDATTSGSCEEVHYHFVGWVTEADRSAGNVDAEHIVNFQDSGNVPTGTTYYAVWAKEAEE